MHKVLITPSASWTGCISQESCIFQPLSRPSACCKYLDQERLLLQLTPGLIPPMQSERYSEVWCTGQALAIVKACCILPLTKSDAGAHMRKERGQAVQSTIIGPSSALRIDPLRGESWGPARVKEGALNCPNGSSDIQPAGLLAGETRKNSGPCNGDSLTNGRSSMPLLKPVGEQ
eukprot:12811970-Alexandrium_andersonii.AAC.1